MLVCQNNRRAFIAALGGVAAWPLATVAQQTSNMRRIGVLLFGAEDRVAINPFLNGLQALGYIDGKTVAIEYRDAGGNDGRVPDLANELVRLNPDVIFSFGGAVSRVAILWNPNHADPEFRETQRASRALEVQLQSLEVRQPDDYERAFQAAMRERAEALNA
jgi:hypothetical protein